MLRRCNEGYYIIQYYQIQCKNIKCTTWNNIVRILKNEKLILNNLEELYIDRIDTITKITHIQYPNIKRCKIYFRTMNMISDVINKISSHKHLQIISIIIDNFSVNGFMDQCRRINIIQTKRSALSINIKNPITKNDLLACKNVLKHLKKSFMVNVRCKINENWTEMLGKELILLFDNVTYKKSKGFSRMNLFDELICEAKKMIWFQRFSNKKRDPIYTHNDIKLYHFNFKTLQ